MKNYGARIRARRRRRLVSAAMAVGCAGGLVGCRKPEPSTSKPVVDGTEVDGTERTSGRVSRPALSLRRSSAPRTRAPAKEEQRDARPAGTVARAAARKTRAGGAARATSRKDMSPPSAQKADELYPWPRRASGYQPLSQRFASPKGCRRVRVTQGSYAYWLRHLPLLPAGTKVRDYQGHVLSGSTAAAAAVVDLDVGKRDLQQCVDTILRLRAEYLWWAGKKDRIKFRYAGGRYFGWAHWRKGLRPKRRRRRTVFVRRAARGSGRKSFRRYLTYMFAMTGTMHHVRAPRVPPAKLRAGDFFIQPPPRPGALGHAVVVLDVAACENGTRKALIGEGYTPAQDFHVLETPAGESWYEMDPSRPVKTIQWPPFRWKDLSRFKY